MTEEEVINKIISEHKFYVNVMPQSTASNFIKRWKQGKAKHKTVLMFMKKFGYVKEKEASYKKVI